MRLRLGYSLIVLIAFLSSPARAADERRLSPAEVEQVLERAAQKREAPTLPAQTPMTNEAAPARPVEGEVGMSIGTGGFREVFGTAVVPLGQEGTAVISFDNSQSNLSNRRRR